MATLQFSRDGKLPFGLGANPIHMLNQPKQWEQGGTVVFEVLAKNAEGLKSLVGMPSQYALGDQAFSGVLDSLEPCKSTHSGLGRMRDQSTLRGVITVYPETAGKH